MNNTFSKILFTMFSVFALTLFAGRGLSYVYAQTTPPSSPTNNQIAGDFKQDIEAGVQQVKNDKEAQNNKQEIDNGDDEQAGDQHGDSKEIDGENNQSEIDQEIEQEVEVEQETGDQSGGNSGSATSTSPDHGDASSSGNE